MVHSPNFWSKKHFLENSALPRTTSYRFLAPCQNLEETNHTIPRKRPERRKDGQTLRATAGFPKNNINKLSGAVLTNALIFSILVVLVKIIFWDTSACLLRSNIFWMFLFHQLRVYSRITLHVIFKPFSFKH